MPFLLRVTVRCSVKRVPQRVHRRGEVSQLLHMQLTERLELSQPLRRQLQPDNTLIRRVRPAEDEPRLFGAVDETDRAVMTE
jgi:hypothetical protein